MSFLTEGNNFYGFTCYKTNFVNKNLTKTYVENSYPPTSIEPNVLKFTGSQPDGSKLCCDISTGQRNGNKYK